MSNERKRENYEYPNGIFVWFMSTEYTVFVGLPENFTRNGCPVTLVN